MTLLWVPIAVKSVILTLVEPDSLSAKGSGMLVQATFSALVPKSEQLKSAEMCLNRL